jgi:6-phosphogluconolactonase
VRVGCGEFLQIFGLLKDWHFAGGICIVLLFAVADLALLANSRLCRNVTTPAFFSFRAMRVYSRFFGLTLLCLYLAAPLLCSAAERMVWFGAYTGGLSKGISVSKFDDVTGGLSAPLLAAELKNPSFLALHPNGKTLYAVHEINDFEGKPNVGGVSAFAIQPDGTLKLLNSADTGGPGPCHVSVDESGQCLLVANYGGGSVISYRLEKNGALGERGSFHQHTGSSVNPQRQKEPHAHCVRLVPGQNVALVADLGLDRVLGYALDPATGKLSAAPEWSGKVPPGGGPRHLAVHPKNGKIYVLNEFNCTLTALAQDREKAALVEKQTLSTLPAGEKHQPQFSTAEIVIHPTGQFLYCSNRGHNTLAVFSVEAADKMRSGHLQLVQNASTKGKTPRNFNLDPSGKWLLAANQDSDNVVLFAVDQATGKLTATDKHITIGNPVCVVFGPELR